MRPLTTAPRPWWSPAATASSHWPYSRWRTAVFHSGIIPAGTGNDHAREYGIPVGDPAAAVDVIVAGHTETIDLGHIRAADGTETWFGTIAATGFDSLVSDRVNRMRWPHGRMRYNLAIVAELSKLRLLPFRLVLDGEREIVTELTLAAFGNTRSYGGGMLICPNADHADGLLDITMIRSDSRTRLMRLFPTVFKGTHVELDEVITDRARTDHRRIAGNQRLCRRRIRLPASGRDLSGARRTEDPAPRTLGFGEDPRSGRIVERCHLQSRRKIAVRGVHREGLLAQPVPRDTALTEHLRQTDGTTKGVAIGRSPHVTDPLPVNHHGLVAEQICSRVVDEQADNTVTRGTLGLEFQQCVAAHESSRLIPGDRESEPGLDRVISVIDIHAEVPVALLQSQTRHRRQSDRTESEIGSGGGQFVIDPDGVFGGDVQLPAELAQIGHPGRQYRCIADMDCLAER